jgi:hypothetical protein
MFVRMRTYFRDPRWELRPADELNYVPVFHKIADGMQYRVGCPFPFLVDPTRKLHNAVRVLELRRDEVGTQLCCQSDIVPQTFLVVGGGPAGNAPFFVCEG